MVAERVETEEALRARIAAELPRRLAPIPLRMVFHEAASWDPMTGTGGMTGQWREPVELDRPENDSFRDAVACMGRSHEEHPELGWADVTAVAGAVAVELCGGPRILVGVGRVDRDPAPPGYALPAEGTSIRVLREAFAADGFSARDLVALSGAHTLGGRRTGPSFTRRPLEFDNGYFVQLLEETGRDSLLASDRALLADPELSEIVEAFAASTEAFLLAFSDAFIRLTWLGQQREPRS